MRARAKGLRAMEPARPPGIPRHRGSGNNKPTTTAQGESKANQATYQSTNNQTGGRENTHTHTTNYIMLAFAKIKTSEASFKHDNNAGVRNAPLGPSRKNRTGGTTRHFVSFATLLYARVTKQYRRTENMLDFSLPHLHHGLALRVRRLVHQPQKIVRVLVDPLNQLLHRPRGYMEHTEA